jgi:hypothetical protein
MKLAVGTPWASPFMWTEYVDAMLNLRRPPVARNALGELEPLEVTFIRGPGWCPARRHTAICEQALAWGADLILIVGADQIHPPDMLERLIGRWNEGYEVVAALVPARGYIGWQPMKPFQPMAWRIKPHLAPMEIADGPLPKNDTEVIDPAAGDVQMVNFIGSGVLMFHRDHLLSLDRPWFRESVDPVTYQRLASMDTTFVWRLQTDAGAKVWVDTTILVKHLHPFSVDRSFSDRFADWAVDGQGDPMICQYQPLEATGAL